MRNDAAHGYFAFHFEVERYKIKFAGQIQHFSKVHLELQFLFLRGRGRRWGTHRIAAASAASTPELSYLTYIFGFLPWLPSPRP